VARAGERRRSGGEIVRRRAKAPLEYTTPLSRHGETEVRGSAGAVEEGRRGRCAQHARCASLRAAMPRGARRHCHVQPALFAKTNMFKMTERHSIGDRESRRGAIEIARGRSVMNAMVLEQESPPGNSFESVTNCRGQVGGRWCVWVCTPVQEERHANI